MNSAPASLAVLSNVAVSRTISLDSASSGAWSGGTCGSPITYAWSRTGGGPPSIKLSLVKNLETEKEEQGSDSKTDM
eukprot:6205457-Pleurochrysis_carterae.AAC.1